MSINCSIDSRRARAGGSTAPAAQPASVTTRIKAAARFMRSSCGTSQEYRPLLETASCDTSFVRRTLAAVLISAFVSAAPQGARAQQIDYRDPEGRFTFLYPAS